MAQVKIVTDSTADLPPELVRELDITIIPLTVAFGKEVLRDGIDIDSQRFFKRLRTMKTIPRATATTVGARDPSSFDRSLATLRRFYRKEECGSRTTLVTL